MLGAPECLVQALEAGMAESAAMPLYHPGSVLEHLRQGRHLPLAPFSLPAVQLQCLMDYAFLTP